MVRKDLTADSPVATPPKEVAEYYDTLQRFYSRFWHPTGVHYGRWSERVHSHAEAVVAMDRLVGEALALAPGSRVLDAGCGIGGTCVRLAADFGLHPVGVTASSDQLARAQRLASALPSVDRPRFLLRSFAATGLEPGGFDGVFGIESVCYSDPPNLFLREAARLLRPGGRLVVLDGFAAESPGERDRRDLETFCRGFALVRLSTVPGFLSAVREAGFHDVRVEELTHEVLPSARRILHLSRFGMFWLHLAHPWGRRRRALAAHCAAGLVQERLLRGRGMRYCLVTATR